MGVMCVCLFVRVCAVWCCVSYNMSVFIDAYACVLVYHIYVRVCMSRSLCVFVGVCGCFGPSVYACVSVCVQSLSILLCQLDCL